MNMDFYLFDDTQRVDRSYSVEGLGKVSAWLKGLKWHATRSMNADYMKFFQVQRNEP